MKWRSLCSRSNLNLAYTLRNGQSFCWRLDQDEFSSVLNNRVISLREKGEFVEYFVHRPVSDEPKESVASDPIGLALPLDGKKRTRDASDGERGVTNVKRVKKGKRSEAEEDIEEEEEEGEDNTFEILRSYFQLGSMGSSSGKGQSGSASSALKAEDDILARLYTEWAKADDRMRVIVEALPGMRILRQPPVECLFSFICSSNNNISRITQMLDKLRQRYGTRITVEDAPSTLPALSESSTKVSTFYSFPTAEALSAASEEDLRGLGLGYRAKFVRATAIALCSKGGEEFLMSLRSKPRKEVQTALLEFVGVGMKVADCVALFSLDQSDCIPVDTHVWNIACCYFDRTLVSHKSLTPTVYEKVGDIFRSRYGASHAGWAHSLLFAAELPSFRSKLPTGMQSEMMQFKDDEKARKADATAEKKKKKEKEALDVKTEDPL